MGERMLHVHTPQLSEDLRLDETIGKSIAEIVEWMNAEIERGATEALVEALRQKGWTVTPPQGFDGEARALPS